MIEKRYIITTGVIRVYARVSYQRGGGRYLGEWFFPCTQDGINKAKTKRSELMARYLDAEVGIERIGIE